NGEDARVLSGQLVVESGATATSPVGEYAVVAGGLSAANYRLSYVPGTLLVDPARLEVVAEDATRPYGADNPPLRGLLTGVLNGDLVQVSCSTDATPDSPEGSYAIVPELLASPDVLANYDLTRVNGTLTVVAAFTFAMEPGFYVVGAEPIAVDETVGAGVGNELVYGGAILTVAVVSHSAREDRLELEATGAGVSGNDLSGSAIAAVQSGQASSPRGNGSTQLILRLAEGIPAQEVAALMRRVTFATSNTNADQREIEMTLEHGTGRTVTRRVMILNRPPVALDTGVVAFAGEELVIPVSEALANGFDVDGDVLGVSGVDSHSQGGATVRIEGESFVYTPPTVALEVDQFGYGLEDGRGGAAPGVVRLQFVGRVDVRFGPDSEGTEGVTVSMGGSAGRTYRIEVSTDLRQWMELETVTASSLGILSFRDSAPRRAPVRLYRAVPIGP
ncbi:MAG: MBG domain-containing protein, partial [Limisphaerales bacterium]